MKIVYRVSLFKLALFRAIYNLFLVTRNGTKFGIKTNDAIGKKDFDRKTIKKITDRAKYGAIVGYATENERKTRVTN